MTDQDLTRRAFLGRSTAAVGLAAVASVPLPLSTAHGEPSTDTLSVVCIGGHPDDPESGCGGTLARYAAAGHTVTIVYLTRGERGQDGEGIWREHHEIMAAWRGREYGVKAAEGFVHHPRGNERLL
jgi:hypothetical protein